MGLITLVAIALSGLWVAVVAAVVLIRWRRRAPSVDHWAERHGVPLTEGNRRQVASYLRRGKALRAGGLVAGVVVPPLVAWVVDPPVGTFVHFGWVFAGYLAGAVCAEVGVVRRGGATVRTAVLSRRRLADYVSRRVIAAQRVLGVIAVMAAVVISFVPQRLPATTDLGRRGALAIALATAAGAMALELIERWLVARPQPFDASHQVAADDAIRATSLRAVADSGLALLLLGVGASCWWLAGSDVQLLRWTMGVPALLSLPLAIWSCGRSVGLPWRVARPVPASAAVPT